MASEENKEQPTPLKGISPKQSRPLTLVIALFGAGLGVILYTKHDEFVPVLLQGHIPEIPKDLISAGRARPVISIMLGIFLFIYFSWIVAKAWNTGRLIATYSNSITKSDHPVIYYIGMMFYFLAIAGGLVFVIFGLKKLVVF